jgi:hypothetical protein
MLDGWPPVASLTVIGMSWGLVELTVASVAGAWLYRE